jgi:hypothetical protein
MLMGAPRDQQRRRHLLPPHTKRRPARLTAIVWYKPHEICTAAACARSRNEARSAGAQWAMVQSPGGGAVLEGYSKRSHPLDVVGHQLPLFLDRAVQRDRHFCRRVFLRTQSRGPSGNEKRIETAGK